MIEGVERLSRLYALTCTTDGCIKSINPALSGRGEAGGWWRGSPDRGDRPSRHRPGWRQSRLGEQLQELQVQVGETS